MKKILILFIAMISFVSMSAIAVTTSDNDIGDKITKVVDVGNPIIAIQEVSADAFSTAVRTNSVDATNIGSGAAFVSAQTDLDVIADIPADVGWLNLMVNKGTNYERLYRRTDHDCSSNLGDITLKFTNTMNKRSTIRFPTK